MVDGLDLPVCAAEDGPPVEGQERDLARVESQEVGQVLVRLLLPAGGPDQFIRMRYPVESSPGVVADTVHDPVYVVEHAGWRARPESEQADHAVHVHEQDGSCVARMCLSSQIPELRVSSCALGET